MQINFLKKVVENTAGIDAVRIVDLIYQKKDVNEFLIAKKLNLTINQTRNLLYRLSHLGIINSIRKKDKRKGWYIYFWTFDILRSLEVLENTINAEIAALKIQLLNKQTTRCYKCKICGREVSEEGAMLTNFLCSECGEVYGLADNTRVVEEVIKKIEKLQRESGSIKSEIDEEKQKIDKKLVKSIKKQEKFKKEERQKKMKIRMKLRNKLKSKLKPKIKKIKKAKKHSKKIRNKKSKKKKS